MFTGRVEALFRYPVKSLLGESLGTVELNQRGVVGDRLYAVSNLQGKFGSGKNTRRFRKIEGLLNLSAQLKGDKLTIKLPCGETVQGDHENVNQRLSLQLDQPVTLTRENEVPHFDDGPMHILTRGDLTKLKSQLPESQIDIRRFRANILIDSDSCSHELLGSVLKIGGAEVKIEKNTERCGMICFQQSELPYDHKILAVVAQQYTLNFGVYASVINQGQVAVGDLVTIR